MAPADGLRRLLLTILAAAALALQQLATGAHATAESHPMIALQTSKSSSRQLWTAKTLDYCSPEYIESLLLLAVTRKRPEGWPRSRALCKHPEATARRRSASRMTSWTSALRCAQRCAAREPEAWGGQIARRATGEQCSGVDDGAAQASDVHLSCASQG